MTAFLLFNTKIYFVFRGQKVTDNQQHLLRRYLFLKLGKPLSRGQYKSIFFSTKKLTLAAANVIPDNDMTYS